jgi:hypothetical protein
MGEDEAVEVKIDDLSLQKMRVRWRKVPDVALKTWINGTWFRRGLRSGRREAKTSSRDQAD